MRTRRIVLVVADAKREANAIVRALKGKREIGVRGPVGAVEALRICASEPPTCAVIHFELQDISGPELCQLIRGRQGTDHLPLLLFSTRDNGYAPPKERLAWADAFLSRAELGHVFDRVTQVIGDRTKTDIAPLARAYRGRHLNANFERVQIVAAGNRVDLTRRELQLLQFLVTYANHTLTRRDILAHVWRGDNDGQSRTIDTHIRRLRVKLGNAGKQIRTLPGIGYRFEEPDRPSRTGVRATASL